MSFPSEFLDKLVGQWDLSGQMGQTPLRQSVEGRWTLGGLFVELYFKSTLPAPVGQKPYEAIYYIGYNEKNDLYVLHLLDTFGVALTYGASARGQAIPFLSSLSMKVALLRISLSGTTREMSGGSS